MKTENAKRLFRMGGLMVLLSVFTALCGCASNENAHYSAVASHLESGGSYYCIADNSGLYRQIHAIFRGVERSLLDEKSPESVEKDRFIAVASVIDLALRLSGATDCRWYGASSVRVPDLLVPTWRNRYFYLLPENTESGLWMIPGRKNRPLLKELAGLPANTIFAADFLLELDSLAKVLEKSPAGKEWLDLRCRMFFNTDTGKLLSGISGEWGVAIFPGGKKTGNWNVVITLPDKGNMLFDRLQQLAGNMPAVKKSKDQLEVLLSENQYATIQRSEDRLTFYSSEFARNSFLCAVDRLENQPDFKRLAYQLPEEGVGICYSAGTQIETQFIELPVFGGIKIDQSLLDSPQMGVLRREKNGLLLVTNSGFDMQTDHLVSFLLMPALMLAESSELFSRFLPGDSGKNEKTEAKKSAVSEEKKNAENVLKKCRKNIDFLAAALKDYAAKNQGKYPEEAGVAGVRKFLPANQDALKKLVCPGTTDEPVEDIGVLDFNSCSYVYFGAWKAGAHGKLPVLIDRPTNHRECFHIVFNDGSTGVFQLENCESIRRIAGFLHTKFQFNEEEFVLLIRRAAQLDASSGMR